MSWVLGIDTSSVELGMALFHAGTPAAVASRYLHKTHAEQISRTLDFLCTGAGIAADQIERIGVACGPGSFTGLRIGIAFVKGFCSGRSCKLLPLSSLLCAAAALPLTLSRPVVVGYEARRNQAFWARFQQSGEVLTRLSEDRCDPLDTIAGLLKPDDYLITDTLGFKASRLGSLKQFVHTHHPVEFCPLTRGLASARLAAVEPADSKQWVDAHNLSPLYEQDFIIAVNKQ
jgi:tRNA threonylcarbamoyladenosine biosynthesis protein TsaB